jgi:outer membrane receptor protein involved in Fe transport
MRKTKLSIKWALWTVLSATVTVNAWAQNGSSAAADPRETIAGAPDAAVVSDAAATAPDQPQAPPSTPSNAQNAQTAPSSALQEVVVTGTNIVRNGYAAPQPLTVVGAEDLSRDAAVNIADTVAKLPSLGLANSPHNSTDSISDGNAGTNNIDLLSIGSNRTLVLLDGVRVAPAAITGFYFNGGAPDINVFPDELVSRVDVVTGGASAAYGSDAVAGVVNFILNRTFTGLQVNVEAGVTTYGDDRQYKGSITWGTGFNDNRGHFLISGMADFTSGIGLGALARPWVNQAWGTVANYGASAANGQPFYTVYQHVGNSLFSPGGLILGGPLNGTDFGPGGKTRAFNFGNPNDGYDMYGGDWQETQQVENVAAGVSLDPRLSRQNLFARLSYDVTDNVQVFGQLIAANTHVLTYCCATTDLFTINSGNPFIPPNIQGQMTSLGVGSITVGQDFPGNGQIGESGGNNNREFEQYLIGANGKFSAFGSPWTWDAYATRSQTIADIHTINNINLPNASLAADVVTNPATGAPICASTLIDPNNGCQPYNPMGIGVNSAAAIDYIQQDGFLHQTIGEEVLSATVRGEPFSDWAGGVSLAFGVTYRDDFVNGRSTPQDESNSFWVGNYHPTNGSYHVTEGFFETVVPLLKDLPGAKSLDFDGAVRETSYSTSGNVTTWKLGLEWSPYSDLRFRATRSRDIRAPNLGELYSKGSSGTGTVVDPFKGGAVVESVGITLGNPDLQPENANELTAGVVFQPSWFRGFQASFDYYSIKIDNSIVTASGQIELNECYAGIKVFCSFINFNAPQLTIYVEPSNTAFIKTEGFDIEASYTKALADMVAGWPGTLNLRLLGTHVNVLSLVSPNGAIYEGSGANSAANPGGLVTPTWRYDVVASYDTTAFSASWTGRGFGAGVQDPNWIQCASGCPTPNQALDQYTIDTNHMPGAFYMDLAFTYHLKTQGTSTSDLFLAIDNVANKNPDFFIFYEGLSPSPYDYLGRVFRAGLRFKM